MSQLPPIIVVVGASRGIGHEFVKQAHSRGHQVIACMRNPTDFNSPLKDLDRVRAMQLDTTNESSVEKVGKEVTEADYLVVTAAIGEPERLTTVSSSRLSNYLDSNVLGPHRVINAFLPALRSRSTRKILIISSGSGSLARQMAGQNYFRGPYSVSKAAVNMLAVQFHLELVGEGFSVNPIDPGWVDTDMGRFGGREVLTNGGITTEKSVHGMLEVLDQCTPEKGGTFYRFNGNILPW